MTALEQAYCISRYHHHPAHNQHTILLSRCPQKMHLVHQQQLQEQQQKQQQKEQVQAQQT